VTTVPADLAGRLRNARRLELAGLLGLLVLAALLRLPGLDARGTWDADQGHDMLVLRAFVRDGVVPLLGPPTSIGDFHHGALYYYLLAPAAALTGGDAPLAVTLAIALAGIGAVAVTWWLGRSIAGPLSGLVAGLAMAISAAAVDESTFIWNPNLIALSSALALAGAWRAWSTERPRWWLVAAIGTAVTMQCHVLGVTLLPIVAALLIGDIRRRGEPVERSDVVRFGLAGLGIVALAYVPLAINEVTTDFSEARAALDYLAGGREGTGTALPVRFGIVTLRVVSWPLVGLITEGFVAGVLGLAAIVAIVAWRWRARSARERTAVRWLGLGLLWSALFLTVAAPSLATVVVGLPNDHYHAFADPMVFVLVGIAAAALARTRPAGPVVMVVALGALLTWNLANQPPGIHPDGGFPAAAVAGERIDAALERAGIRADQPVRLRSLPAFKSTEAYAYPLIRGGRAVVAETPTGVAPGSVDTTVDADAGLVLICDRLFEPTMGVACGGAAETTVTPEAGGSTWGPLLDRFEAAPGRIISVYAPAPPG
jgi:4-amino-4-deoxy-L-arabinose transferase-like glycosyltransferase